MNPSPRRGRGQGEDGSVFANSSGQGGHGPLPDHRCRVARTGSIIGVYKKAYFPVITEEALRTVNQFQKQAGVVKSDFSYDKMVAVQFKHLWEQ